MVMQNDGFELIRVLFQQLFCHHWLNARIFNYAEVGGAEHPEKTEMILSYWEFTFEMNMYS